MDIKLIKGNRYLFHNQQEKIRFRGNFIDIITRDDGFKTLIVDKYIYESGVKVISEIVSMPFSWINKIETLVDIVNNSNNTCCVDTCSFQIAHVSDVLLEIDSFL